MGARPEQQLTLNFLAALHGLWVNYPDRYIVEETVDDLVPALAQICIKALATEIREPPPGIPPKEHIKHQREVPIEGRIVNTDGSEESINLREVVNKIIHGTPTLVVVKDETVRLHFRNNDGKGWTEAWFSGTQLLQVLGHELSKHAPGRREVEIAEFLRGLGEARFLPTSAPTILEHPDR
jgi:hypothetical protein